MQIFIQTCKHLCKYLLGIAQSYLLKNKKKVSARFFSYYLDILWKKVLSKKYYIYNIMTIKMSLYSKKTN